MLVVACKLPHGLSVRHAGRVLDLNGPNVGVDPLNPGPNRTRDDTSLRSGGFGLTVLNDTADIDAFKSWVKAATLDSKGGKLPPEQTFPALINGSILPFDSLEDAREETRLLGEQVVTGVEGIDPATDREMQSGKLETLTKD